MKYKLPITNHQLSVVLKIKKLNDNCKLKTENSFKGFTLIELLVAISIIGVLSTLILANFNAARERARDTQRKSDLGQIRTALRVYYNDSVGNVYPSGDNSSGFRIIGCGSPSSLVACEWGESWTTSDGKTYMEILPKDPNSSWGYRYVRTDPDSFTLQACLENKSDSSGKTSDWCSSGWMYEVKQ